MKTKYLNAMLSIVSKTTEVSAYLIKSKQKNSEIVLSRRLFILVAMQEGFTTSCIALFLKKTTQTIRMLYQSAIDLKTEKIFETYYNEIMNKTKQLNKNENLGDIE